VNLNIIYIKLSNMRCTGRNIGFRLELQKNFKLEKLGRVIFSLFIKLFIARLQIQWCSRYQTMAKGFKGCQIGCQKVQGRIAKSSTGRAQTMPSEDAKCSVSEVQQPPQPARMEPVSRLSRLLSLSLSITRSFSSSSRTVDPSSRSLQAIA